MVVLAGRRNDAISMSQNYQAGVLSADKINVSFENVGGKLVYRNINEADVVHKGDILLTIEDIDLQLQIKSLEASIQDIRSQIRKQENFINIKTLKYNDSLISTFINIEQQYALVQSAQARLDKAKNDYKRYLKLIKNKAVSQADFDSVKSEYINAKSELISSQKSLDILTLGASKQSLEKFKKTGDISGMMVSSLVIEKDELDNEKEVLASLIANLNNLEANLEQLNIDLSRSVLKAPCDGKILEVVYQEGEMVAPNVPAVVIETDRLYCDIYMPENIISKYSEGQHVKLYAPALDSFYQGTIRYIKETESFADLRMTREQGQADMTAFEVRIYLDKDSSNKVIPGMLLEFNHENN